MEEKQNKLTLVNIINQFEKNINLKFPEEFINFYLHKNGGYTNFRYVKSKKYIFSISEFFSFKYGNLSIEKLIQGYKNQHISFDSKIPFAEDEAGNIYLIELHEKNYSFIYLWEIEESYSTDNLLLVSNSFSEFINSFTNEIEWS